MAQFSRAEPAGCVATAQLLCLCLLLVTRHSAARQVSQQGPFSFLSWCSEAGPCSAWSAAQHPATCVLQSRQHAREPSLQELKRIRRHWRGGRAAQQGYYTNVSLSPIERRSPAGAAAGPELPASLQLPTAMPTPASDLGFGPGRTRTMGVYKEGRT